MKDVARMSDGEFRMILQIPNYIYNIFRTFRFQDKEIIYKYLIYKIPIIYYQFNIIYVNNKKCTLIITIK